MPLSFVSDLVLSVKLTSYTTGTMRLLGTWRQIARPEFVL
jgi:hypothetical protein